LDWKWPQNLDTRADGYYVSGNSRDATFSNQALFVIENAIAISSGVNLGPLYCSWAIEMWDPQTHLPPGINTGSGCLNVFQGSTAVGGTLASGVEFFPLNSTGNISAYTIHNDGGVTLSAPDEGLDAVFRFKQNGAYYLILHQTGTGIGTPVFSIFNHTTSAFAPSLSLIASGVTSTTQDLQFYVFDLSIDAGAPQLNPNSHYDISANINSTSVTAYSWTWFSDPDAYNVSILRDMTPIERRLYLLEHKDEKKSKIYHSVSPVEVKHVKPIKVAVFHKRDLVNGMPRVSLPHLDESDGEDVVLHHSEGEEKLSLDNYRMLHHYSSQNRPESKEFKQWAQTPEGRSVSPHSRLGTYVHKFFGVKD